MLKFIVSYMPNLIFHPLKSIAVLSWEETEPLGSNQKLTMMLLDHGFEWTVCRPQVKKQFPLTQCYEAVRLLYFDPIFQKNE